MSKRRANIARRAPKPCSTSWRPPDHRSRGRLSSPLIIFERANSLRFQTFNRFEREIIRKGEKSMPRNNRGGRNNNPSGRNQYSSGWIDTAKDKPIAAAAAAAAAVGAGVFLWSRRT